MGKGAKAKTVTGGASEADTSAPHRTNILSGTCLHTKGNRIKAVARSGGSVLHSPTLPDWALGQHQHLVPGPHAVAGQSQKLHFPGGPWQLPVSGLTEASLNLCSRPLLLPDPAPSLLSPPRSRRAHTCTYIHGQPSTPTYLVCSWLGGWGRRRVAGKAPGAHVSAAA